MSARAVRAIAGATCLLACVGSSFACRPLREASDPQGPALRVLTYNVNYAFSAPAEALAAILAEPADIVCLQESTPEWEAFLRSRLADRFPEQIYRYDGAASGQAILSRWPLRERRWQRPAAGWFPAWIVEAETALDRIQIAALHLRPPLAEGGRVTASAYFGASETHREEIVEIAGWLRTDLPTLFLGDFNESETGGAVAWLEEQGFSDALALFDDESETWRWPTSLYTFRGRYDHVVFSPELDCVRALVLDRGRSDHLPVLATLVRQNTRETVEREGKTISPPVR